MFSELLVGLRFTLLTFALLALAYPFAMTGMAQAMFPHQANGSLIRGADDRPVGSELVGQKFEGPQWFHGRPSTIDYKAEASGASNLGPGSQKLLERVQADVARLRAENPAWGDRPIPVEMVTTSASGMDPHISPDGARMQAQRVAGARGVSVEAVDALIARHVEGPDGGLFGEQRVNVLRLNLALAGLGRP
jgi:K+-transporting ATPase ATPase C chain